MATFLGFRHGVISAVPIWMNEKANALAERLKRFATRVVRFARALPPDPPSQVIARQLTKSGTGAAANYHSARRARSRPDFISKLAVAAEEADESENWFGVIANARIVSTRRASKNFTG
jgi:four helix bundle protein